MDRLTSLLALLKANIRRQGGGWAGMWMVVARSLRIVRALGLKGLLRRVQASRQTMTLPAPACNATAFPPASPLEQVQFRAGVMVHIFYGDLIEELAEELGHMPTSYVLMISVVDAQTGVAATARFAKLPNVTAVHVRVVPNQGRDIAPFLLDFRDEILALDLVCHIHTKKSLHAGDEQSQWRRYLLRSLLGSPDRISWILGTFQAMPELSMVYPETFRAIPWWAHTWLSNLDVARELGGRLGVGIDPLAYIDFPLGSMFWARTEALRPLFELNLARNDFPAEQGQSDGTAQHAIERLFGQVVRQQGGVLGILSADDTQTLLSEGERNWTAYFNDTLANRIGFAAVDADCISFDLFDTLVTRPFLRPSGLRDYVAHQVKQTFGLMHFSALREQAELLARANSDHDVDSTAIYAAMTRLPELCGFDVAAIRELELAIETRLLKPRVAVLDAAFAQARSGKRVIAVSDMYLNTVELRRVLPEAVSQVLQTIHVSCDTGWRKDSGEAWRQLPRREGVAPAHWLHVGDNEHADVQLPLALGLIAPVHTMRPGALLDVVPALRPLRPPPNLLDRWQDQLWLGLLANHFGALADRHPQTFGRQFVIETPETFGYAVLGPLLLDYSTWLARLARERGAHQVLFLSREGYLLLRVFRRLQQADGSLDALRASYLLVSRRAVNTPSLRAIEDLTPILAAPYTGPLDNLLRARLGDRVAEAVGRQLGPTAVASEVYLPEMGDSLIELLRPVAESILDIANDERAAYLAYWSEQTGGDDAVVADIGYAGTIQSRLTTITGASLLGAYFAVKKETAQLDKGEVAARFYDGRRDHEEMSPVMRHHLLLEAAISAPDGQFSHFSTDPQGIAPRHFPNAMNPAAWATVERIQSGAMQFIDDVCEVTGRDSGALVFDSEQVQKPLHCVGTGLWRLGSWSDTLAVEDQYSGRGDVAVSANPGAP